MRNTTISIFMLWMLVSGLSYAEDKNLSIIDGKLDFISTVPDPKKSDYPDCYFSGRFILNRIISGKPVPREIVVLFNAFLGKKLTQESRFRKGDLLNLDIIPFEDLPPDRRRIQQVDETNDIELKVFFAVKAEKTNDLSKADSKFIEEKTGIVISSEPLNPPLSQDAVNDRHDRIANDLTAVKRKLEEQGNIREKLSRDFAESLDLKTEKFPRYKNHLLLFEKDSVFVMPKSHNPFRAPQKINSSAVDAISGLNRYLKFHNIDLIVILIPYFFDINSFAFNPEFSKYDIPSVLEATKTLLENNIEVIDISDEIKRHLFDYKFMYFSFALDDHPAEGCVDIATSEVAKRLKRYSFPNAASLDKFSKVYAESPYNQAFLFDLGPYKVSEKPKAPIVLFDGKPITLPDEGAPIIVMGNSYIGTPGKSSFSHFLAQKTGVFPVNLEFGGSGPAKIIPSWILRNERKWLQGTKSLFLVIGSNYLYKDMNWINIEKLRNEELVYTKLSHSTILPLKTMKINDDIVYPLPDEMIKMSSFSGKDLEAIKESAKRQADAGETTQWLLLKSGGNYKITVPITDDNCRVPGSDVAIVLAGVNPLGRRFDIRFPSCGAVKTVYVQEFKEHFILPSNKLGNDICFEVDTKGRKDDIVLGIHRIEIKY